MTTVKPLLPPDLAEYFLQAGEDLAKLQGFKPGSEDEMRNWLDLNMAKIAERAIELQQELYNKVFGDKQTYDVITEITLARVWGEIRSREIDDEVHRSVAMALGK